MAKKKRRPQASQRPPQRAKSQSAGRRPQAPPSTRVRGWVWAVLAVTVAGVVAILLLTRTGSSVKPVAAPPGVKTFAVPSRNHVGGTVNYPQTPPVGGDHSARFQNCGVYTSPIQPEMGVHSMEHGAVWITYRPDLDPGDVQKLQQVAHAKRYVLLSPWKDSASMPAPIVLSAWGVQQQLGSYDQAAIDRFVATYAQGPQTPEPGAPCSGGNGNPK